MQRTMFKRLNNYVILLAVLVCSLVSLPSDIAAQARAHQEARVTASFDNDWRFLKADAGGAEKAVVDFSAEAAGAARAVGDFRRRGAAGSLRSRARQPLQEVGEGGGDARRVAGPLATRFRVRCSTNRSAGTGRPTR